MTFLKTLFVSSRPLSWVNTAFPFAAAYLMTARQIDVVFVIGTLFFLIPYNVAMYGINDVFDYESDMRNPRKGGVEGAVLAQRYHRPMLWAVIIVTVPFVVALVVLGNPQSWIVLAVSLFAVVAYSIKGLRFKEIPFVDSVTSSTHFVSPAIYGLVLAGAAFTPALWLILIAFFLWGTASHAFGAVQDIKADRDAKLSSIATALGAKMTTRLAIAEYALAGVLLATAAGFGWTQSWPVFYAAFFAIPYIGMCWPYRSLADDECERAHGGWRFFLAINFLVGFGVTILMMWRWAAVPSA
ncbi:MAG: prenyltransferase [Microbacteriaceae bacterium]|jgi:4-hydroxybenzoate polyprenyltransferase